MGIRVDCISISTAWYLHMSVSTICWFAQCNEELRAGISMFIVMEANAC